MVYSKAISKKLQDMYQRLMNKYGSQHWWPADEPFEVMVGAILTQSAAWRNVEKAIVNLKAAGALSPAALREIDIKELSVLIHPSGYYNVKARKLKALAEWFGECCNDDLDKLRAINTEQLREELLAVWGIGEETADSIILYAANQPVFVIDAYTRRIIDRIGLTPDGKSYADYQALFMDNPPRRASLPSDVQVFNEYHALLVCLGKNVCRKQPLCQPCCLREICALSNES